MDAHLTNQEKFNETVGILVRAYFDNTLEHHNCHACAVGNIVAAKNGYTYKPNTNEETQKIIWSHRHRYYVDIKQDGELPSWYQVLKRGSIAPDSIAQVRSTGYSVGELKIIERAFESVTWSGKCEDDRFSGLMSVVDVLAEIHGIDLTAKENAKLLFVKCPAS